MAKEEGIEENCNGLHEDSIGLVLGVQTVTGAQQREPWQQSPNDALSCADRDHLHML